MADVTDAVKQAERLVRMIEAKVARQKLALADSEAQLTAARRMLDDAKKVK